MFYFPLWGHFGPGLLLPLSALRNSRMIGTNAAQESCIHALTGAHNSHPAE